MKLSMKTKINRLKFFISLLFCIVFIGVSLVNVAKADTKLNIYLFWGNGCPHCAKEKEFLNEILPKYPQVNYNDYEVYYNQANSELMRKVSSMLGSNINGIPYLIIGDKEFVGFSEGITDLEIEDKIEECLSGSCPDSVASIISASSAVGIDTEQDQIYDEHTIKDEDNKYDNEQNDENKERKTVNLPFLGSIDALDFSLPVITIIMGVLDGFNPCAMWVLLFLISLLLGFKDRKKMWILGLVFIFASALCYFLFMAAWLNLILFIGFIAVVRVIIGIVALAGGAYSVRKGLKNKDGGCEVTSAKERRIVFEKLRQIASKNNLFIAIGGMILLAFAVNLVELVCSAGLPAVFTQVLTMSNLEVWQYHGYILLYIFFFMLDDIIVFAVAMITLRMTGISTKYSRYSSIIGGLLMLIIGLMLVFKPELLMFG